MLVQMFPMSGGQGNPREPEWRFELHPLPYEGSVLPVSLLGQRSSSPLSLRTPTTGAASVEHFTERPEAVGPPFRLVSAFREVRLPH